MTTLPVRSTRSPFLRRQSVSVPESAHQRTPEKMWVSGLTLAPATQVVSSGSEQNSGASSVCVVRLIDEPLAQFVPAVPETELQYCADCMR